jgi:hypothetical protein
LAGGIFYSASAEGADKKLPVLSVFYSPSCHRCQEIKDKLMPYIENKFSGKIQIAYRDISKFENYKLLLSLEERYKPNMENSWPVFFMQGHFVNGIGNVGNNLLGMIYQSLDKPLLSRIEESGAELINHFRTFTPLLIISVGLVDGVNPCAFTVIVFFISFLSLQGYKKKELWAIGLSFIFAVFLAYILIGLGLFGFLYRFKSFWLARKIFNICVGSFSIILAILAIYDAVKYRKTHKTEGLLLQLPGAVKNQIHKVIGLQFRKTKDTQSPTSGHTYHLIAVAFVTGLLVSVLEAVCTGQTYLPTIAFIFNTTSLKAQAMGYLLLYNIVFVVPLFVVFLFALWGATSEQFANFLKSRLLAIKISMAILFFFIGAFLIWRA